MKKAIFALALILILSVMPAHEQGIQGHHEGYYEKESRLLAMLGYATLIIGFSVAYSVARAGKMSALEKKIAFGIISLSVILVTGYIIAFTITENLESATGGPVHWHADYEVWVCGERLALQKSNDLSGRIGTNLLHNHNDYRIHVEGTVREFGDVSLGNYFSVIGGQFSETNLSVILEDGTIVHRRNGDDCNGEPGKVQLYVNGEPNSEFGHYVLAPYSTVPPGDYIHIVFDSTEGVPIGG